MKNLTAIDFIQTGHTVSLDITEGKYQLGGAWTHAWVLPYQTLCLRTGERQAKSPPNQKNNMACYEDSRWQIV